MKLPEVLCMSLVALALAASAAAQEHRVDGPGSPDAAVSPPAGTPPAEPPAAVPRRAAPRLVLTELQHDFGAVTSGKHLRWAFKIKNAGTADLLIESVAPS